MREKPNIIENVFNIIINKNKKIITLTGIICLLNLSKLLVCIKHPINYSKTLNEHEFLKIIFQQKVESNDTMTCAYVIFLSYWHCDSGAQLGNF